MALISLLSSPNPAHHHLFRSVPLSGNGITSALTGCTNGISYRLAGPAHLSHAHGETPDVVWMAEGNTAAAPEQLNRLMQDWSDGTYWSPTEVASFHQKISALYHDGFVAAILSKKNDTAIVFNDRLGRLPLYLAVKDDSLMISRQIFHIHQTLGPLAPNAVGTAFHLMFGFQTADNTLWKEVRRIMPGSAVIMHNHTITIRQIDDGLFFAPEADGTRSELIAQTVARLDEATRACSKAETILSMSGGLDSRLLAASLAKQGLPFSMVSYADAAGSAAADIRYARELARVVGKQLNIVNLGAAQQDHFHELHKLKHGLNYSGMAFLIPFLKQLPATARVFTGDGGDKLLAPVGKIPPLRNIHQLACHIIDRHALMSPAAAAILTGTDQSGLIRTLETDLNTIFEKDLQHTYSLFLLRRRAFKWLFEGEDRNRWYVDHAAPIWHQPLASFLLRIPAVAKEGYSLFSDVLMHYNPELATIPNANWAFPVTARRQVRQLLTRQQYKYSWPFAPILRMREQMLSRHQELLIPPEIKAWYDEWHGAWLLNRHVAPPLLNNENLYYLYSLAQGDLLR